MNQLLHWYHNATIEELAIGLIVSAIVVRIVYDILTGEDVL